MGEGGSDHTPTGKSITASARRRTKYIGPVKKSTLAAQSDRCFFLCCDVLLFVALLTKCNIYRLLGGFVGNINSSFCFLSTDIKSQKYKTPITAVHILRYLYRSGFIFPSILLGKEAFFNILFVDIKI